MKFSEAMLRGYAKVGGKQCFGKEKRVVGGRILAYCPVGAAIRGGMSREDATANNFAMRHVWGDTVVMLNDHATLPWEHIYGMAVAADL